MNLKTETEKLVKQVFNDVYGHNPSKIRSFADEPPSEKNGYLFNAMMAQYEGICTAKSVDYLFYIYYEPDSKDWEYEITPIASNN